jgi:hypothetical protein
VRRRLDLVPDADGLTPLPSFWDGRGSEMKAAYMGDHLLKTTLKYKVRILPDETVCE